MGKVSMKVEAFSFSMDYSKHIRQEDILKLIGEVCGDRETYVIGGYVRDLIMGKKSKDIDVVCVGSGIELAKKVSTALMGKSQLNVFKNFGTAQLKVGDQEVEFVGARKESYRNDSRKPIVEDGTIKEDQERRDFTINALAIRLDSDHFGELVDPFDGVADIKRKIIKTPLEPNVTFSDDPLRIMRAFRFSAQLIPKYSCIS